jgi:hypothetical protein
MKPFWLMVAIVAAVLTAPVLASAQHSHGHGMAGSGMKMDTREVLVEGVKVTFHIMANAEHQKMLNDMKMKEEIEAGTTHNITVVLKDERSGKDITDAAVAMKVVDPRGREQLKKLKYEGAMKSHDAYFSMPEKGTYELLVLIKAGDLKKTAGIPYEVK